MDGGVKFWHLGKGGVWDGLLSFNVLSFVGLQGAAEGVFHYLLRGGGERFRVSSALGIRIWLPEDHCTVIWEFIFAMIPPFVGTFFDLGPSSRFTGVYSSGLCCCVWDSPMWRLCSWVMDSVCRVRGLCPSITATLEEILPSSSRRVARSLAISLRKESNREGISDESREELLLRRLWWRCFLCRCFDEDMTNLTITCFSRKKADWHEHVAVFIGR